MNSLTRNNKPEDFAFDIHKSMKENNVVLAFTGEFDFNVVNTLISSMKKRLNKLEMDLLVRKRIHNIMVECLDNIFRHSHQIDHTTIQLDLFSIFTLNKIKEDYYLITGNYIDNDVIPQLKKKLDNLNELNKEERRDLYRELITDQNYYTEKGTAGIGIIDMAIKAGNELKYEFKEVDENTSFYIFQVKIEN